MFLQRIAALTAAALTLTAGASPARAAEPVTSSDHISDVVGCGDPDAPDFLVDYQLDQEGTLWSFDRGRTDAAAHRSQVRGTETYAAAGHTLVRSFFDSSQEQWVQLDGDLLRVTTYSTGTVTWTLDGNLLSRSSGTIRLSFSELTNGTPDDRSDDYDWQFLGVDVPGQGHNLIDDPDPCAVLAPYAA